MKRLVFWLGTVVAVALSMVAPGVLGVIHPLLLLASPLVSVAAFLALDRPYRVLTEGAAVRSSGNSWLGWRWVRADDGTVVWCGPATARALRARPVTHAPPVAEALDGFTVDLSDGWPPPSPSLRASALALGVHAVVAGLGILAGWSWFLVGFPWETGTRDWGLVYLGGILVAVVVVAMLMMMCWGTLLVLVAGAGQLLRLALWERAGRPLRWRGLLVSWGDDSLTVGHDGQQVSLDYDLFGERLTVHTPTQRLRIRGRHDYLRWLEARLDEVRVRGDASEVPEALRRLSRGRAAQRNAG